MSKTVSIGLAGTFTVDPITRHLKKTLAARDIAVGQFHVAPYNQLHQLSFQPGTVLEGTPDILIVFWRLEDWQDGVDNLLSTLRTLRQNFSGTLIVSNAPYPSTADYNAYDLQQGTLGLREYTQMLAAFTDGIAGIDTIRVFNLAGLIQELGAAQCHDARKWYLYKNPYTETLWKAASDILARMIAAETIAAKKCIVLDCDNTLWGGIIGEDGLGGIQIGQDFPGSAFTDFQRHMLHLRSKGLFLAIASKNNEEDVLDVFDNHDAMVLQRDHISAWQVHWRSKVESLQAIAQTLNIGTDALVFIDDNPKEIAEVQERLPEVTCFIVPEELAALPGLLAQTDLFDMPTLTDEDRKRADMMLAETKRSSAKDSAAAMTEEEFIQSLDLKINVFEAREHHLARITQLINKTNQFNVTTRRRTADDVKAIAQSDDTIFTGHGYCRPIWGIWPCGCGDLAKNR